MDHSELRLVTVIMRGVDLGGGTRGEIMHRRDVETFIKAQVELHYAPGVNPHSGGKTWTAWRITVSRLAKFDSYWWTVPGLQDNHNSKGARITSWRYEEEAWANPALIRDRLVQEHNSFRKEHGLEPLNTCAECRGTTEGEVEDAARCQCDNAATVDSEVKV